MAWSSCQWRLNCLVDADCEGRWRWRKMVDVCSSCLKSDHLFLSVGLPGNCLIPPTLSHWGIRLPAYSIWGNTHSVLSAERLNCLYQRHSPRMQGWRHSGVQCSRDESSQPSQQKQVLADRIRCSWLPISVMWTGIFLQPSCWKIWTWDSTVWICLLLQWAGRPPPARLLFV